MSNALISADERHLSPHDVEELDRRRRRGQLLLTIGLQLFVITVFVSVLWVGQDLTQSPGWVHPIFYWAAITGVGSVICFIWGLALRRGFHEFTSY